MTDRPLSFAMSDTIDDAYTGQLAEDGMEVVTPRPDTDLDPGAAHLY